uniref:ORF6 n=1 Tax=Lymantria dispar multicapsid nuclear polyhedrosis virus TaxID=10449 RepID=A0A2S1XB75_NPVLD|nr:ORF6 [Lymantria dispar multiple nucleopolyhedrovirus]
MSEPDGRHGAAGGAARRLIARRLIVSIGRLIARRLIVSIGRLIASRTRSGLDGSIRYRYGKLISRTVRVDCAIVLKQFLTCQV